MLNFQCAQCGAIHEVPEAAAAFDCPRCGMPYEITMQNGSWALRLRVAFDVSRPITWFEMQIAPFTFRFAVAAGKEVLFSDNAPNSRHPQETFVLEERSDLFLSALTAMAAGYGDVFGGPQTAPDRCFTQDMMQQPSFHLRVAWDNHYRWASMYPLNQLPPRVRQLFEDSRAVFEQVVAQIPTQRGSADEAHGVLDRVEQQQRLDERLQRAQAAGAVARIKVLQNGDAYLNGRKMRVRRIISTLKDIQAKEGVVIYFREQPERDPTPAAEKTFKALLDEVSALRLPIMLSRTDFEA